MNLCKIWEKFWQVTVKFLEFHSQKCLFLAWVLRWNKSSGLIFSVTVSNDLNLGRTLGLWTYWVTHCRPAGTLVAEEALSPLAGPTNEAMSPLTADSFCSLGGGGGDRSDSPPGSGNGVRLQSTTGAGMEQEKRIRREIANSNERRRMQSINAGFQSLRTLLPHHEGEKLSKVSTLYFTRSVLFFFLLISFETPRRILFCELLEV